jgi:hypothetical protein
MGSTGGRSEASELDGELASERVPNGNAVGLAGMGGEPRPSSRAATSTPDAPTLSRGPAVAADLSASPLGGAGEIDTYASFSQRRDPTAGPAPGAEDQRLEMSPPTDPLGGSLEEGLVGSAYGNAATGETNGEDEPWLSHAQRLDGPYIEEEDGQQMVVDTVGTVSALSRRSVRASGPAKPQAERPNKDAAPDPSTADRQDKEALLEAAAQERRMSEVGQRYAAPSARPSSGAGKAKKMSDVPARDVAGASGRIALGDAGEDVPMVTSMPAMTVMGDAPAPVDKQESLAAPVQLGGLGVRGTGIGGGGMAASDDLAPPPPPPPPPGEPMWEPLEVTATSASLIIPVTGETLRYQHLLIEANDDNPILIHARYPGRKP